MNVLIVESPAKAKTINKYLGKDFKVLASFGHVRDLPSKDGSVRPEEDFAMTYEVDDESKKHLAEIIKAMNGADALYLATDPDREGEAISWHVLEALKEKKALPKGALVKRIVFNEITKRAVEEGMAHPRDIDMDLVNAQQARRALDYLVGFTLSPLLWRKLPGSKSAGRVQSVALRLICDRELEIEQFVSEEYWDIRATLAHASKPKLTARLTHVEDEKLEKFSIPNEARAKEITARLEGKRFQVINVEPKQARRNPPPPFTTSTLQQEASRKLGFSARKTMQIAQRLYEGVDIGGETVGLITYMRTDGVSVAQEALMATRGLITRRFGQSYLPEHPRMYKAKAKNAQEAHEAIRPTDITRLPEDLQSKLDHDQHRLYELIWKRMTASQMESALFDQVAIDFESEDRYAILRANGSVIRFDGFMKLYCEDNDDKGEGDEDEDSRILPQLEPGETLNATEILPEQHFTEPPPRYSEASLVKKLEELGIGRPSTYASIISVLQDRQYVRLEKKRFLPEERGRVVSTFLTSFFTRYVEYDFTAKLEDQLDEISAGQINWKEVLQAFWQPFHSDVENTGKLSTTEIIRKLNEILGPYIFPKGEDGQPNRACPACGTGKISIKLGKFGAFIGCSNYPECRHTATMFKKETADGEGDAKAKPGDFPKVLGLYPGTQNEVLIKQGPYGFYIECTMGEKKPKRVPLGNKFDPYEVTLEIAVQMLGLPREVGQHPETREMITAGIGRFGPYIKHGSTYVSLKEDDVLDIGINRAVTLLAEYEARKAARGDKGGRRGGFRKGKGKKAEAGATESAEATAEKPKKKKAPAKAKSRSKKAAAGK